MYEEIRGAYITIVEGMGVRSKACDVWGGLAVRYRCIYRMQYTIVCVSIPYHLYISDSDDDDLLYYIYV